MAKSRAIVPPSLGEMGMLNSLMSCSARSSTGMRRSYCPCVSGTVTSSCSTWSGWRSEPLMNSRVICGPRSSYIISKGW